MNADEVVRLTKLRNLIQAIGGLGAALNRLGELDGEDAEVMTWHRQQAVPNLAELADHNALDDWSRERISELLAGLMTLVGEPET
jgi:hypothetical protein